MGGLVLYRYSNINWTVIRNLSGTFDSLEDTQISYDPGDNQVQNQLRWRTVPAVPDIWGCLWTICSLWGRNQEPTRYPAPIRFGWISELFCLIRYPAKSWLAAGLEQKLPFFGFSSGLFLSWVQNKGWRWQYRSRAFGKEKSRNVMFNIQRGQSDDPQIDTKFYSYCRIVPRDPFTIHNRVNAWGAPKSQFTDLLRFYSKWVYSTGIYWTDIYSTDLGVYSTDICFNVETAWSLCFSWSGRQKTCFSYLVSDPVRSGRPDQCPRSDLIRPGRFLVDTQG